MAGIGFVLRRLSRQDTLTAGLRAYAHGAIVSSGPWLFTIMSLGTIDLFGRAILDPQELRRFLVVVMYNFAFSLVASGPIVMVITRRLADKIYAKDVAEAPGMFIGSLLLLFTIESALGIPFYGFMTDMQPTERLVAFVGFLIVGGIWVAASFISALKSFGTISAAFGVGALVALVAALVLGAAFGGTGMLAGFTIGLAVIFFGIAARIFAEYPYAVQKPFAFLEDFRRYWELALIGLLYNAAIWVDKWIMWLFAPGRVVIAGAMPAHPAYDGAMFLAYLTVVPAMATFLVVVETRFFEHYVRYYRDIQHHATAAEIWSNHRTILRVLADGLRKMVVLQGTVCYLAILVAPGLIGMARGELEMVPIFRFGVLGALGQVLLLASMVVISYFDLRRVLLSVSAVFLVLNTTLTLGGLWLGLGYFGYGYFMAAVLSMVYAYVAVASRLLRLPYMTFIANNPGLR
ncbi:MAG: exopolysaccharide Pel transporter PelG [Acetobacteraceae bacterium]|nr:exopolysaccharide Pel transporter PelG [Acetobacteraceae bacterium]